MILVKKKKIESAEFENLLVLTRKFLLNDYINNSKDFSLLDASDFENAVCEAMKTVAIETGFKGDIYRTKSKEFPDIIADDKFGVEVKTAKNKWDSFGNSIFEKSRIASVERIYVLFCRYGNTLDIRIKPYQDCLSEIRITHSPRYEINMELPEGKSIFSKFDITYEEFLNKSDEEKISHVRNLYRKTLKEGQMVWWLEPNVDSKPMVINSYNTLAPELQQRYKAEAMAYFLEIFSEDRNKYRRASEFLLSKYIAISSSLRDIFSASGRVSLKINGTTTEPLPHIYFELQNSAKLIAQVLHNTDEEVLKEYWKTETISDDRETQWIDLLKKHVQDLPTNISINDIYYG